MEHIVSINCFNIVYTTISCELEFPSSKGEKKSFFIYLKFDDRISDCVTKDNGRVWFREYATFLFRYFKRDVEYHKHERLIDTKLNWEDYLAIFKMILYLAIERCGLEKYRLKDFYETTYNMLYDRHDHKYTFDSYKDKHIIYPSENTKIIDPIFNLPHLVYTTIDKLYPIQERLSKFFFYNSYDTTWLVSKGKDWTFLDDHDREEFLNKYVDDSFKKVWYVYKISNNGDCKKYIQYFKLENGDAIYETVNFYNDNIDFYKIATYYEEEAIKIRNMLNSSEKDKKHQWRISADSPKTQNEALLNKESNMEIFVSKKKKDGSLYLVDKCGNESVRIKLPDELKKAFEKAACIKLKDDKEISLLPNKILLYRKSGDTKEDLEKSKSIILSWLPEEKYRKMLFTSFVLLLIKIKSKHISIDKDIFERFKITDTKASYDKLYDIADLLIKIMFNNKHKYKGMKEDFSLY